MIGSLMYITTSNPDIMQVVGMVGCFYSTPKQIHLAVHQKDIQIFEGYNDLWSLVS